MGIPILRRKLTQQDRMKNAGVVVKEDFSGPAFKPKKISLNLGALVARGQNVEIYLPEKLNSLYLRKDLCLKVFKENDKIWGHPRGVGRSTILESSMVQNLMSFRGLAPRVYDIVEVNGKTAQVTDYIKGENKVVPISDDRLLFDKNELSFVENFIDGKLVDFQGTVFKNFEEYKKNLIQKAKTGTPDRGSHSGTYQSGRHFEGFRNTKERLKKYRFPNLKNKTVLDIGCHYGMFCQEAVKLGAKRVVGIDWPAVAEIARELANLDGFFNIDFIGIDIKYLSEMALFSLTGIKKFDIHLFLAMENWVGWPSWAKNCDILYYEGHGAERPFKVYHYN